MSDNADPGDHAWAYEVHRMPVRIAILCLSEDDMKQAYTTALLGLCLGVLTYPSTAQGQKNKPADKPAAAGEEQAPKSIAESVSRNLEYAEGDFLSIAEAMPEDKYSFIPTAGKFEGVRSFAEQVKHVACAQFAFFNEFESKRTPISCGFESHCL
jgi:hypothetical protein